MLTKYAFFSGTVKAGREQAMRAYVDEHLLPLWRGFQPSEQVRVLYGVEQEPNGPTIPLVLAVTYRDHDAMAEAMNSDARHTARELLPELYRQFFDEINLWHYVFDTEQFTD